MHLAPRAYLLIVLTAVLAIAGIWSEDAGLAQLWRLPALLLLVGISIESRVVRRAVVQTDIETMGTAVLGRPQQAAFVFRNVAGPRVEVEYAPAAPAGYEPLRRVRRIVVPAGDFQRDAVSLLPVRLGPQVWPELPARLLGPLRLVWWARTLHPDKRLAIAPDVLRRLRPRARDISTGMRPRRVTGAGSELHQLRSYVHGDPPARIDWKATARARQLVTREFSEDQHLDILIAIDAGRLSRVRAGSLDRFGLYANIAARFAEAATPRDDRVGLIVFAERTLALCPPERGLRAVMRLRQALEQLQVEPAESDPVGAAIRIRRALRHRGLVVFLTDLEDASVADALVRAVRLLAPPHLVVVAGVHGHELEELARRPAASWLDPWVALAAREREARAAAQQQLLRRLGAPVIVAREGLLEEAVLSEYERLRRSRSV